MVILNVYSSATTTSLSEDMLKEIRFSFALVDVESVTQIPNDYIIRLCTVIISAPYDNNAGISVGHSASPSLCQSITDNDPAVVGNNTTDNLDVAWGATTRKVKVTITNAPTVGSGICIVRYIKPNN